MPWWAPQLRIAHTVDTRMPETQGPSRTGPSPYAFAVTQAAMCNEAAVEDTLGEIKLAAQPLAKTLRNPCEAHGAASGPADRRQVKHKVVLGHF